MDRHYVMTLFAQATLSCSAVMLSSWMPIPRFCSFGLGLMGVSMLVLCTTQRERVSKLAVLTAYTCTLVMMFGLPISPDRVQELDVVHALLVWLMTTAIALGVRRATNNALKQRLKTLAMIWAFLGFFVWLASSYVQNQPAMFFTALVIGLTLLICSKQWFQMPGYGIQLVNTLILLLIGLPLLDLATRPTSRLDTRLALTNKYYSYRAAKQNPAAFRNWWENYLHQWDLMAVAIFTSDPTGMLPFRLKPNANGFLFESPIRINDRGFRGREFRIKKGDTYRIVVIGESTTFGCTLLPGDQPWPEVLEQVILERLKPQRPVEVINGGVPAYSLQHNVRRLPNDILPLQPDLILSYHGANGFYLLDQALPRPYGKLPPAYRSRPVKLLADCEYRLKMIRFRRRLDPQRLLDPTGFSNPLSTPYAVAYRDLIEATRTNGISLALANYAMAVNTQSDSDVVEFYRTASPSIHWQIRANAVHTEMVKRLTELDSGILFVDTHPNLDGDTENFIDMAHMTQAGRNQMAENFFAAIKSLLERDLTNSIKPTVGR